MNFILAIDGGCDENFEQLQYYKATVMPSNFLCDGETLDFTPRLDSDFDELYENYSNRKLKEIPRTRDDFEGFFDELFELRRRDIIYISAELARGKSDLSVLNRAIRDEAVKFPRNDIYAVAAPVLSVGISPLIGAALKMRDETNLSAAEAFLELQSFSQNIVTYIVTDTLVGLKNQKLLGADENTGGTLIKQFVIKADKDGFKIIRRSRGNKTSASILADAVEKAKPDKLYLGFASDFSAAKELRRNLDERGLTPEYEIKRLNVSSFALLGKNALTLSFMKKN